jgi:CRISPR/Cas system-associated protein Cas5 (RAMP superfamily)
MSETKAESKIMDTLMEETEEIMEYKPYDKVDRPMHYTAGSIETIDYIQSVTEQVDNGFEAVCIGNALKYISRQHLKNGKEDLKKAIWYLNRLIEYKGE